MLHSMKRMGARALLRRPLLRTHALRALSLLRSLERSRPGIYTLCYHHVVAAAAAGFAAQLALLGKVGPFIDADEAVVWLNEGRARRERAFVVTFDDGYADNVDVALPVLRRLGIPAVLFLVGDWLDAPPAADGRATGYVTREDVACWLAAGQRIGSHSLTHRRLATLGSAEVAAELGRSRHLLSELAGTPVRHFACPWGVAGSDYRPERDPDLAAAAGYLTFFTTRRGRAQGPDQLREMPRHVLEPEWDLMQVRALLGESRFARA